MSDEEQYSPSQVLARLLREAQANQRLTATELAARIGCPRTHLYRWLNGECLPKNEKHLEGIARICGQSVEFLHAMVSPTPSLVPRECTRKEQLSALCSSRDPAELPEVLAVLAADILQVDQAELYLAGLTTPLPCLWCVNPYFPDPAADCPSIPLAEYVRDWSAFTPQTREDLIVRAFATQQVQELADAHFLQQIGCQATWLLAAPLVQQQRSLGCLVCQSASRTYLTSDETAWLHQVCQRLVEGLLASPQALDRLGMLQAARKLVDKYRSLGGDDTQIFTLASPLAGLTGQIVRLSRLLVAVARHLRSAQIPYHDVSLQQMDSTTGLILAIGTRQGQSLLPAALLNTMIGAPCWQALTTDELLYRPNLLEDDPYGERDPFSQPPVVAILDVPFSWGADQGTVGLNSLHPEPWDDMALVAIRSFVQSFKWNQV